MFYNSEIFVNPEREDYEETREMAELKILCFKKIAEISTKKKD